MYAFSPKLKKIKAGTNWIGVFFLLFPLQERDMCFLCTCISCSLKVEDGAWLDYGYCCQNKRWICENPSPSHGFVLNLWLWGKTPYVCVCVRERERERERFDNIPKYPWSGIGQKRGKQVWAHHWDIRHWSLTYCFDWDVWPHIICNPPNVAIDFYWSLSNL